MTHTNGYATKQAMEDTRKSLFIAACETIYEQEYTDTPKDVDALKVAKDYRFFKAMELMTFHRYTVDDLLNIQQQAIAKLEGHNVE